MTVRFDECKAALIAEHIARFAEEHDIVPSALHLLARLDGERGTAYVRTLFSFLAHHQNKTATCLDLAIHRTTLDYRLGRIADLASIDFADDTQVRYLTMLDALMTARHAQPDESL